MKIEHLQECIHLAQTLNFTQTSRAFYITQPVLSKHISGIEHELGIRIFTRSTHGVRLTAEGRVFVQDAVEVVKRYDNALDSVSRFKSGARGQLNVGYLLGVGYKLLPSVIRRFSYKEPQTALRFFSLEITEIPELLRQNVIDIGITTDEALSSFPPDLYGTLKLFPDRYCAVVPKDHPLAGRQSVSLEDLKGEELLATMPSFMKGEYEGRDFGSAVFYDISYSINEVMSFFLLMMTGTYVSIAYKHLENVFGDDFAYLPVEELDKPFSTFAVWKKSREQEVLLSFAEELARECRNQDLMEE